MIDSALYSRSTVFQLPEEIKMELSDTDKKINRSTLYHLINSFVTLIHDDQSIKKQQKIQACSEFGFSMGRNIAEEQSLGNVKYFVPKPEDKNKNKPFLGEMKFLNTRVWPVVFGSSSKLFAIVPQLNAYKFDDKQFGLTRFLFGSENERIKSFKRLIYEFSKGVIEGFCDKFELTAEVIYNEVSDNNVNFEVKKITKIIKNSFK